MVSFNNQRTMIKYIFILFPFLAFSQAQIAGQVVMTQAQLDEIDSRIDAQSSDYWASGNGFFGDGLEMYNGAENFLSEESTGSWQYEWDYETAPFTSSSQEPTPDNFNPPLTGSNRRNMQQINDAALLSLVWKGRSESATFNGIILRRAQDAELDWSNATKHPTNASPTSNPHFIIAAWMSQQLRAYDSTFQQLEDSGYASFTSNRATVEGWFKDFADLTYARIQSLFGDHYGAAGIPPYADNEVTTPSGTYPNCLYNGNCGGQTGTDPSSGTALYSYYESNGDPGTNAYSATWAIAVPWSNRIWDNVTFISSYGVMFNNSAYTQFGEDMFKAYFELAAFPDGTAGDFYRSYDGTGEAPRLMFKYFGVTVFALAGIAMEHAIGVQNGLAYLGSDKGKFFDWTTSRGTDEIYSTTYVGSSTSGGTKGLYQFILHWANWYRTSAQGGWKNTRYAEGGTVVNNELSQRTVPVAFANMYYQDPTFENFYKGINFDFSPDYYSNGNVIDPNASWGEPSAGPWAGATSFGRFFGVADMENITFSQVGTQIQGDKRTFYKLFYDN